MQQTRLTRWQRCSLWLQQAIIHAELGPWQAAVRSDTPSVAESL